MYQNEMVPFSSVPKECKSGFCYFLTPCRAASEAAASSQILFWVGNVLPLQNMFLDTLFVQWLLEYNTVVGLQSFYFIPDLHPFRTKEAKYYLNEN